MHYSATTLHDGTVLAAYPIRRPPPSIIKRDHLRIDEDGLTRVSSGAGRWLCDVRDERRFRFQDIVATNLNTRRAIRDLVLPPLEEVRREVAAMRAELDRLTAMLPHPPKD